MVVGNKLMGWLLASAVKMFRKVLQVLHLCLFQHVCICL